MNWTKIVGLIPARKGSKGLIDKNIKVVAGKPLIGYTIEAAKESVLDEVYVSSNDDRVEKIAQRENVYFIDRPDELSSDASSANDVISHFISMLRSQYGSEVLSYLIIYLQPTSPLRTSQHINSCIHMMKENGCNCSISVTENKDTPYKYFSLDDNGKLQSLFSESLTNARRQDLPITFKANGAIYCFLVKDFISNNSIPSNGSLPYIMSFEDSVDIDDSKDLEIFSKYLKC